MENLMPTLKRVLLNAIDDIDAGNSNINEEDAANIITAIQQYSHKDQYFTKYQACKYLNNISRATFDNLVKDGKLHKESNYMLGITIYFGKLQTSWHIVNKIVKSVPKLKTCKSMGYEDD